jgi:hypothetical protein
MWSLELPIVSSALAPGDTNTEYLFSHSLGKDGWRSRDPARKNSGGRLQSSQSRAVRMVFAAIRF